MRDWRNLVLRAFGAKLVGKPFVSPSARIHFPWHLEMGAKSAIGPRVDVYNLGRVRLGRLAVVSQDAALLAGTHDFSSDQRELITDEIVLEDDAFVGARAMLLAGTRIRKKCLIGAGAVVKGDTVEGATYIGNPAQLITKPEEIASSD